MEIPIVAMKSQIMEFFTQLNVATCVVSTLYTLQKIFVNNMVYSYWLRLQGQLISSIQASGEPICVSGDGQFDSPGHSAAYCYYR